jgi:hypothetical protein
MDTPQIVALVFAERNLAEPAIAKARKRAAVSADMFEGSSVIQLFLAQWPYFVI